MNAAAQHSIFGGASPRPFSAAVSCPARARVISASYQNKENIDLSRVPQYKQHESDSGSTPFQVAILTARVEQISKHLATNRKDHAAKRGLVAILSQRKSLLQYLHREDRSHYDRLIREFGIRPVVVNDTRGASRDKNSML
eukprot:CAMPEP_0119103810 /NCGR_PEP_ID=MMETSP1180-20130426/2180_1 /TAXON_ID=3052 ORGANISM="Chlamydomonas cf sp, Strain CCMP681" /NCGR_SAMPLE_ID=MMETSP1180 /ASSEMBLY_ACC=CAM_ASM_000741 /LENGTH=140 /DNA_ID=CAMNT_0007088405 /DNA_START=61 /DNA_END=483 /DNA_ORIENTATION=-